MNEVRAVLLDLYDTLAWTEWKTMRVELQERDRILVRRYPHSINLLHPVGHSYYAMLRQKLNWNRE